MKQYKYMIFDLDGTLLFTLPDMKESLNVALTAKGYPAVTLEQTRAYIGNGVRKLVERALPGGAENPDYEDVYQGYLAYYLDHNSDHTVPYEGILELLDSLSQAGVGMAVVTNKDHRDAEPMIRRFFGGRIAVTVGKKDYLQTKPAPDGVWEAMASLGAKKEECVYIGDSEVDYQTAQNAGLDCLLVSWGYRERELLSTYPAVALLDRPQELLAYAKQG